MSNYKLKYTGEQVEQLLKDIDTIVIEANESNIVDFNNIIDPGVYVLKNVGAKTSLNAPGDVTIGSICYDIILKVTKRYGGNQRVWQTVELGNTGMTYFSLGREYQAINSTWTDWKPITTSTVYLAAGLLKTGMKCNAPTDDKDLANKLYVDNAIANIDFSNVLTQNGTTEYQPTEANDVTTKQYVDEAINSAVTNQLNGTY